MSDREEPQPVANQILAEIRVALNERVLILDNFTDAGDGIVTSMVVHGHLLLLALNLGSDSEIDTALKRLQAEL